MKKNSIIWSIKEIELAANVLWDISDQPYILTTFDINRLYGYYDFYDDEQYKFSGAFDSETIFKYQESTGVVWYLIKALNLNTFKDLIVANKHSEEEFIFLSNDVSINRVKQWIECSDDFFVPTAMLDYKEEYIINLCELSVWYGVTEQAGNDDLLVISSQIKILDEVIDKATNNNLKLPDYTDSLDFKINYHNQNVIFMSSLREIIKRIYRDSVTNPWDESSKKFRENFFKQAEKL